MTSAVQQVIDLLDLESIEVNIFRGRSPDEDRQRVFGGQVMGQALVAAQRTVDDARRAHSLHGYFLRPGDPTVPILYEVDRIRDGRSFATRRVVGVQHGRAIFNMSVSFQLEEPGAEFQLTMPNVAPPEELVDWSDYMLTLRDELPAHMVSWYERPRPIETRPVELHHPLSRERRDPPNQQIWFRASAPVPDDLALHQAVLTYAVDMWLLDCSTLPHGVHFNDPDIQMASLDHTMWFLRPFRSDEWMLLDAECISTSASRGLNRSNIYTASGALVASASQEGLIRRR